MNATAVLIPVLNEERHLEACVASLLDGPGPYPHQVLILDGGSTDRTWQIAESLAARDPRIAVLRNPGRLQSAAVNLGARLAADCVTMLVRADAHATYPPHFIDTCVAALARHAVQSVVVPMVTRGARPLQRAIAAAQNSRMGNGGAAHRVGGGSRLVDHGHHAAFDRAFFQLLGGYDESFSHNEDAEFDLRARQAGGRIWMCQEAAIAYFPRETLGGLARQYFRHGRGRGRTVRLHRQRPRLRQLVPVGVLAACILSLALTTLHPGFLAVPLCYAALCQGWAVMAAVRAGDPALCAAGLALMAMHLSWACGFLSGVTAAPRRAGTTP